MPVFSCEQHRETRSRCPVAICTGAQLGKEQVPSLAGQPPSQVAQGGHPRPLLAFTSCPCLCPRSQYAPPRHTVPSAAALTGHPFPGDFSLWPPQGLLQASHAPQLPLTGHTSPTSARCSRGHARTRAHTHAHTHARIRPSVCVEPAVCCPPPPHHSLPSLCSAYILWLLFLLSINESSVSLQTAPH